jgi:drug/metabolite transporter (DMT)-like permease
LGDCDAPRKRGIVFLGDTMNVVKAFLLKAFSALLFALLSACVRYLGEQSVPLGQMVFFRAAFAVVPVLLIDAWRRELADVIRTERPLGHLLRGAISMAGMFLNFAALARLPLVDATAISFAAPLITVAFAAWFLGERVRIYRWSAVAVGFAGIIVMLWPYLNLAQYAAGGSATVAATVGVACGLTAALTNAGSVIQTRRLTDTETTSSIVFFFSLFCAIAGLATLPFGWIWPSGMQLTVLIAAGLIGGLAHIVLTSSYRYAPASLVAPLDYTTMIWAFVFGYALFGEVPTIYVFVGGAIVAASGIFVIWRERQLGLRRVREAEGPANIS